MTVVLRKSVMVAGTPGRALRELHAGTRLEAIDEVDLAQLHPDHFSDVEIDEETGAVKRTGLTSWKSPLGSRITKLADDLRALDESPGVDSSRHVDDLDVFAGHPDEENQRAAREAEKETSK
jgi:hypothetical protein